MKKHVLRRLSGGLFTAGTLLAFSSGVDAFNVSNPWRDTDNISMHNSFMPADFQGPAENQLAEWNFVDTFDGGHPFLIFRNSTQGFAARDGRNVMGFLGQAGLNLQYGLNYSPAIAWNIRQFDASGFTIECDTALDPNWSWDLSEPSAGTSFRSVVLHEQGHCRGLAHSEGPPQMSIMYSIAYPALQHTLYTDDREAIRRGGNSTVPELDVAAYNRYPANTLDGNGIPLRPSLPGAIRVGDTLTVSNLHIENRGTQSFGSLRFGTYLSFDTVITSGDHLVNNSSFSSLNPFTVFNGPSSGAVPPSIPDCGLYYVGTLVDDLGVYNERNEDNNTALYLDPNTLQPKQIQINLRRDALEPNDFVGSATVATFSSYSRGGLSIDSVSDADWFRYQVPQNGSSLSITVSFQHALGDIDIELYNDATGEVVGGSAGTGDSETINVSDLAAGVYNLRVFGFGAGGCNRQYDLNSTGTAPTALPILSIEDVAVTEGNSGTVNATFVFNLSEPSTETVSVRFATADNTATAGSDYVARSGTVSFTPGQTRKTTNIVVNGDTLFERDFELFFVNLSNPVGLTIGDGQQGVGTIIDDDTVPLPAVSINDVQVTEGNSGTRNATFTFTLSGPSTDTVSVRYASANGTATAGSDYVASSGIKTFNPGQTTQTVSIVVNGDTVSEPDETFLVNLSTPVGLSIADGQGLGTIANDDTAALPTVSVNDVQVTEGNSGTRNATFTFTLSGPSTDAVSVRYATANGTATAGSDYVASSGIKTFNPGQTSQTVSIVVNGDTTSEPDETFFINLSSPVGVTVADGQGLGTIANDDTVTGTPGIRTNVSSFNFGSVRVGQSSAQRMLVITNTGTAPLQITSIRLAGDYTGTSGCSAPVAPGGTCTLTGSFRPTATGPRPGSVTITSNAPTSPTVVQLSGTGT